MRIVIFYAVLNISRVDMMDKKTPQEVVRSLLELGFTQKDLEKDTGVKQPSISRILTGKNADPRISTVRALEQFYLTQIAPSTATSTTKAK
ncbi:helix-turn-helix transcriptional regulator [Sodalis endosymbiont of Spalangia cameroni]|uniref:helix-turn-helix transcriptional regulator n=1 Tax=Sodalis praecaptivus TaxID=1239307 RepID=UPI0031F76FC2